MDIVIGGERGCLHRHELMSLDPYGVWHNLHPTQVSASVVFFAGLHGMRDAKWADGLTLLFSLGELGNDFVIGKGGIC